MTNTFLTKEQIAAMAPAVLETGVSSKVSSKYVHVPTIDLIDDMATMGWNVVDVKQRKVRKGEGGGSFGKHMVVFRNDDVVIKSEDGEVVYPQILLSNSHDGLSSFQFRAGLFRLICSNGLVIATKDFGLDGLVQNLKLLVHIGRRERFQGGSLADIVVEGDHEASRIVGPRKLALNLPLNVALFFGCRDAVVEVY